MPQTWMQYWKPRQIRTALKEGRLIHLASNQFKSVKRGDRVWVVGDDGKSGLVTIGFVDVDRISTLAEVRKQVNNPWPGALHLFASRNGSVVARPVSLSRVAAELRFESARDRLNLSKPTGQQLQAILRLAAPTANLLSRLWATSSNQEAAEQTQASGQNSHRYDIGTARRVIDELLPIERARLAFAELAVAVIRQANSTAPNSWELTLQPRRLRLNVGQVAILQVSPEAVLVYSRPVPRPRGASDYYRISSGEYGSINVAVTAISMEHSRLIAVATALRGPIADFAHDAALSKKGSPWKAAHSPAAVDYLFSLVGLPAQQPAYWPVHGRPASEELPDADEIRRDLEAMKAVEVGAVRLVTRQLEAEGWTVRSREADKCGFDLECRKGSLRRHIEVKGRGGAADRVILTSNEWECSLSDAAWELAIVSNAAAKSAKATYVGRKDVLRTFSVDPIAYRLTRRE